MIDISRFQKHPEAIFGGAVTLLAALLCVGALRQEAVFGARALAPASAELLVPAGDVARLLDEANALKAKGLFTGAVSAYEKAIAHAPDYARTYFELGALYFHLGLNAKSEEYYQKAIDRHYKDPEIYFHIGYIKETAGRLQDALEWYLKAEEKGVGSAELYFNIGNVFAQSGNNTKALEYYRKAVGVKPSHMDAFVNLSIVSFHEKKYADAEFYLAKARALGYTPPEQYLRSIAAAQVMK